jgi:dephospho-CoA kinase
MLQIGLTGGIGSGKSTIAKVLEKMGYPVFYADLEAKKIYHEDPVLKENLIQIIGQEVYMNGQLNTKLLAEKLFSNTQLKDHVAALVHPIVREAFVSWVKLQKASLVFNEAAILFETGAYQNFDANLLVVAPAQLRIERVIKRDALSEDQVQARIAQQWSDEQKMKLTPYLIHNDGRPLLVQIEKLVNELQSKQ